MVLFLIADKDVPVTKISCLQAHFSMKCDLEMYYTGIWGHFSVKKGTQNLFIARSMLPSNF